MQSTGRVKVLVVEDEQVTAMHLLRRLQALGYDIVGQTDTGADALRIATERSPDIVLMDIVLRGSLDGIQTVEQLRQCVDVPVVYLTANGDTKTIQRAKLTNPSGFLVKPFEEHELQNTLQLALYRHQSEAQQRLYQRAIAASVSAIFIADARLPDKPIIQANPAFEQMTGYSASETIGKSCWFMEGDQTDAAASAQLRRALEQNRNCRVDLLNYRKDGTAFWNELTLSPVPDGSGKVTHFIGVQHDVTALRSLENQLRQAQKLESMGQLAAGIAHEINTPTQYIGDNTRFLRDAFNDLTLYFETHARLLAAAKTGLISPDVITAAQMAAQFAHLDALTSEIPKAIEQSLEGIERVSRIVRAMKEFSHPGTEEKVTINVNDALESTLAVSRNEWKYVANAVTELDPRLPLVTCLRGEMNQTFLNLVVNASHAIAEAIGDGSGGGKGTITISTRQDGEHVEIRVRDTGTGIPEEIQHRIFDPFFTTKQVGKGTGQGLAIAWRVVVEKHGGTIRVESEVGKGTLFIIRLPIRPPVAAFGQKAA